MASLRSDVVQKHLQTLFDEGAVGSLTDGELLERFILQARGVGGSGLRDLGRAARPDGAGDLPATAGRRPRRPGCLTGGVSGARQEGPVDSDRARRSAVGCTPSR